MKNLKDFRFACTRCGNCCTDKDTLVNLTYLDIIRIRNGLKLNLIEVLNILGFYIFEKKITREDKKRLVIEPIETEKGLAFVALHKNNLGECYFYNSAKKKCMIYNLRPMFCRTFPFSFGLSHEKNKENRNKLKMIYAEKGKQYCPGISEEAPIIDYDKWIKLGKQTIEELEKNYKIVKNWNDMVKKKKIAATVKKFLLAIFQLDNS